MPRCRSSGTACFSFSASSPLPCRMSWSRPWTRGRGEYTTVPVLWHNLSIVVPFLLAWTQAHQF